MELRVKALSPRIGRDIPAPFYATAGAAAMDLHACLEEPMVLEPGQLAAIPTGLAVALPEGYMGLIFARSGLGVKHGITLPNGVGVVDQDYRGEIKVGITNLSREPYTIQPGERVAQFAVVPVARPELVWAHTLDDTPRGAGGFGSTGR